MGSSPRAPARSMRVWSPARVSRLAKRLEMRSSAGRSTVVAHFDVRATKVGADTALAQIVQLVQTAQNSKAPAQRLADQAAQYLVIAAVSAGLLTFLIWFFLIHQTVLFALTLAVTAVVIACPDALGLATPTAVAVGTGIGARHGILIKNATALEQTSRIQAIIFDKTGTLTEGKPSVTDINVLAAGVAAGFDEAHLLQMAASCGDRLRASSRPYHCRGGGAARSGLPALPGLRGHRRWWYPGHC